MVLKKTIKNRLMLLRKSLAEMKFDTLMVLFEDNTEIEYILSAN